MIACSNPDTAVDNGQAVIRSEPVRRIAVGVVMIAALLSGCTSTDQNALSASPRTSVASTPSVGISAPTSSISSGIASAASTGPAYPASAPSGSSMEQAAPSSSAPTTVASSAIATVVAQLGSADPAKVKAALGMRAGQTLPAAVASSIAALKPIVVDYTRLVVVRPGVAQVSATTKDGRRWLLTLAYNTRWYLVEADPQ